ncbi:helix-turn-helix domain-containing protein, partial [Streptomyces sp. SID6041]|nr:helix-turn-helix domain-containing protein [Streptomyces sp. SID6041]
MSHPSSDPLAAVDALLAAVDDGHVLPAPVERVRLREAAGLTQAAVAQALGVRVPSIQAWEEGRAEPKSERLQAYRRLLEGLAQRYPAPQPTSPPAIASEPATPPAIPSELTAPATPSGPALSPTALSGPASGQPQAAPV